MPFVATTSWETTSQEVVAETTSQEVVAETITNSIKAEKIPNAYLFTGIRGIGKTTTARIVAKALNCSNGIEKICREKVNSTVV